MPTLTDRRRRFVSAFYELVFYSQNLVLVLSSGRFQMQLGPTPLSMLLDWKSRFCFSSRGRLLWNYVGQAIYWCKWNEQKNRFFEERHLTVEKLVAQVIETAWARTLGKPVLSNTRLEKCIFNWDSVLVSNSYLCLSLIVGKSSRHECLIHETDLVICLFWVPNKSFLPVKRMCTDESLVWFRTCLNCRHYNHHWCERSLESLTLRVSFKGKLNIMQWKYMHTYMEIINTQ